MSLADGRPRREGWYAVDLSRPAERGVHLGVDETPWRLRQLEGADPRARAALGTWGPVHPAAVPSCVHLDLERAGRIAPLEETGDGPEVDWIGRTRWVYERRFDVDARAARAPRLELVLHGLVGVCTVRVDGREVLVAQNQFRRHVADVTGLAPGEHELRLEFADTFEWLAERERRAGRVLPGWGVGQDKDHSGAWLRASPVMFGWDFAPRAVTVGPSSRVELVVVERARLVGCRVHQDHRRDGSVAVRVEVEAQAPPGRAQDLAGAVARAVLVRDGVRVGSAHASLADAGARLSIELDEPVLWWPSGEGDQRLHELWVELRTADGAVLDREVRRVGLRTVELVCRPDGDGESFGFRVNGRDVPLRGANFVPNRLFAADEQDEWRLVERAASCGLNALRVWGGGPYASEDFYDACDRHGILVWQDLPFSCATYPAFDAEFRSEVEAELREQCRRLHHRASLALLCGNNELENGLCADEWDDAHMSWRDYGLLFDELFPRVVAEEASMIPWWPGSPHTPVGDRANFNDPRSGDAHLWDVWHGEQPFEHFLTSRHRFVSEFGFQSPAEPTRLRALVGPDLSPAAPRVAHRQRSRDGDARIDRYLAREGVDPTRLDPVRRAHLARVLQALGLARAVEHWRRAWPHCGGFLIWQWNEPWLAPTWAAMEAGDHPRPLASALSECCAQRAANLRVGPNAAGSGTSLSGHFVDHSPPHEFGPTDVLEWQVGLRRLGRSGEEDELVDVMEGESPRLRGCTDLFERDLDEWISSFGLARGEVHVLLEVGASDGFEFDADLVPAPLGRWRLVEPSLRVLGVRPDPEGDPWRFEVDVECRREAWFPVVTHARYAVQSANQLTWLVPGSPAVLRVWTRGTRSPERLREGLSVLTLWDLLGRS